MLHIHRLLAEAVGVPSNHTFILKNGEVIDIVDEVARQTREIPAGDTYVDGVGTGEVEEIVLRDRKQLSEDGMLVVEIPDRLRLRVDDARHVEGFPQCFQKDLCFVQCHV